MHRILTLITLCFIVQQTRAQDKPQFQPLTIGKTTQIKSAKLNETRTINIYLPRDYKENDTTRYPVIYVIDGGIQEDFIHLSGLVQYNTQPWVNRMPKSIVVGIENTNRQRDFTFPVADLGFLKKVGFKKESIPQYGGSANYIAFIGLELQPFINQHFKTNSDRTLIGESLGGLLATEVYAKHRQLFNNYIIISPSLWWGNEALLQEMATTKADSSSHTRVYIGAPNKDEMPVMYNDAEELSKVMKKNGNTKAHFDYLPQETHATVSHLAVYNAFRWLGQH